MGDEKIYTEMKESDIIKAMKHMLVVYHNTGGLIDSDIGAFEFNGEVYITKLTINVMKMSKEDFDMHLEKGLPIEFR